MMINRLGILLCFLLAMNLALAQNQTYQSGDSSITPNSRLVSSYIKEADSKAGAIDQKLDKHTTKLLQRWKKQEEKISRKLAKRDSLKAASLFSDTKKQYEQLEQKLQSRTSLQHYSPSLDTLRSSIKFLQQNPQLFSNVKGAGEKVNNALSKVNGLQTEFQKAEDVKAFLKQRRQYLKEQLSQLGFAKELKKLNKIAYYYNSQVQDYALLLNDHKKAEQKVLELLSKTKLFKDFMRKNSMLSSLFRLPGDPEDPLPAASLAGLQTRAQVSGLIQQMAASTPAARQQIQENIQAAQSQLNELKNKVTQLGSGSSDAEMPEGFKVNPQKGKNFWRKWELGVNVQSNRANGIMPVSSDLGISAGFKPNGWFIAGGGLAGRIGWGKDIRHIAISYSGIGIRTFAEMKLKSKGSFSTVAGYEMNYHPEIKDIEQLKDKNAWSSSGLVGISKVVSMKTKFFKKTSIKLLWDFLSYRQLPKTQPLIFRIGYSIK